jgi:hypothetical protein
VQVVAEYSVQGSAPVRVALGGLGLLGSEQSEQVMTGEPAGEMLGEHGGVGQLAQHPQRLGLRYSGQAPGGRAGDVIARVDTEKPE